jgi:hypothetical protein
VARIDGPVAAGHGRHVELAAVQVQVDLRLGLERATFGQRLFGVTLAAEAEAVGESGHEGAGHAADHEPGDDGGDDRELRPRGDDRQPDDDDDHRPEAPSLLRALGSDGPRLDG